MHKKFKYKNFLMIMKILIFNLIKKMFKLKIFRIKLISKISNLT